VLLAVGRLAHAGVHYDVEHLDEGCNVSEEFTDRFKCFISTLSVSTASLAWKFQIGVAILKYKLFIIYKVCPSILKLETPRILTELVS